MKRLILTFLVLALCLSGCAIAPQKQQAEAPAPEMPAPEAPSPAEPAPETPAPEIPAEEEEVFEEIPLLSLGQLQLTVTNYLPDAPGGPLVLLEVQNGMASEAEFSIGHASIAGVMCDPYWSCTAPAGETLESRLWWSGEQLALRGISALQDVKLELTVRAGETVLFDETVIFAPEAAEPAVTEPEWPDFPAQVLAETEEFTVTACNYEAGVLTLAIDNRSERELLCAVTEVTADGEACDPRWAALAMADALCWSRVEFPAGLQPKEITMLLSVYDNEDHAAPTLFRETVTVTIP